MKNYHQSVLSEEHRCVIVPPGSRWSRAQDVRIHPALRWNTVNWQIYTAAATQPRFISMRQYKIANSQRFRLFFTQPSTKVCYKLQRRSFLQRWDGNVFFLGTIVIDGFSMVLPSMDQHHWMFFTEQPLKSMVFPSSGAMVSDGFDLENDLKMCITVTGPILRQLRIILGSRSHCYFFMW